MVLDGFKEHVYDCPTNIQWCLVASVLKDQGIFLLSMPKESAMVSISFGVAFMGLSMDSRNLYLQVNIAEGIANGLGGLGYGFQGTCIGLMFCLFFD